DALLRRDEFGYRSPRGRVESGRVIDQPPVGERAKACVEMVEARIGETKSNDAAREYRLQQPRRPRAGTPAMAAPDQGPRVVEQRVASAFERDVPRPGRDFEALGLEPGAKRGLLRLSFLGREMADDGGPAHGEARVGGKNHVG